MFGKISNYTHNKEIGSIIIEQDLKLTLFRHWSVYESMMNSNYLVSKLCLWKEPGRILLRKLLATAGIALDDAK